MTVVKNANTQFCVTIPDNSLVGTQKIIMTFKNSVDDETPLFTREYTSTGKQYDFIKPEEASFLKNNAVYDFVKVLLDGRIFRMNCGGRINVETGVGGYSA